MSGTLRLCVKMKAFGNWKLLNWVLTETPHLSSVHISLNSLDRFMICSDCMLYRKPFPSHLSRNWREGPFYIWDKHVSLSFGTLSFVLISLFSAPAESEQLTLRMSSRQVISGLRPPWTQRNCWLRRAARGRQSNASIQASYTCSEYFILPGEHTRKVNKSA